MTTGFLNLHLGGIGATSAPVMRDLWKADLKRLPLYTGLLDTEEPNQQLIKDGTVDAILSLRLSPKKVHTLLATPNSFGPTAARIMHALPKLITPDHLGNGARTVRALAQLMFEVRRDEIAAQLNRCLVDFRHKYGVQQIIPILHTSSGGGTGSALGILLPRYLMTKSFRSRVLQGLTDDSLGIPFAFVVEPFFRAAAHSDDPLHTARILGNAMAFRIESAMLERLGFFNYLYHLGLSNGGGVVLDNERDVARVLGTSAYLFQKHYETQIKPRTVDRADIHRSFGGYLGDDIFTKMAPVQPTAPAIPVAQPVQGNHRFQH